MESDGLSAWCEADGQRERLDMRLVGAQPAGTWVLAFMGAARQVMLPLEAEQARGARQALAGGDTRRIGGRLLCRPGKSNP